MRDAPSSTTAEAGFTLTELLVVILIVGLLAAIAVPTLLGQRDRGRDARAKGTARTVVQAMTVYGDDHDDSYACGDAAACLVAVRDIENAIPHEGVTFSAAGGSTGN